jgi:anti-sigma factor (TIGR02949 family)
MECPEARDHLAELTRGRLAPELADAVRTHAAGCAACAEALRVEAVLHTLIRAQAPRYAAPPALRARVQVTLREAGRPVSSGWRAWRFLHPWMANGLAGALAALIVVWVGTTWLARDPVSRLVSRAVDEHVEYAREAMHRPAPNPVELLATLRSRTSFPLGSLFPGDTEALLISTTTAELRGKPAVALVHRNGPERYTTLLLMPGADATIPAEDRLPIETFKPHHRVASGKQALYWKQHDLACLMVSDLDEPATAAMFLKIRKAG